MFLAHYRRTRDANWLLYQGGVVVAVVADPYADAAVRFPGRDVLADGVVNVDVVA